MPTTQKNCARHQSLNDSCGENSKSKQNIPNQRTQNQKNQNVVQKIQNFEVMNIKKTQGDNEELSPFRYKE